MPSGKMIKTIMRASRGESDKVVEAIKSLRTLYDNNKSSKTFPPHRFTVNKKGKIVFSPTSPLNLLEDYQDRPELYKDAIVVPEAGVWMFRPNDSLPDGILNILRDQNLLTEKSETVDDALNDYAVIFGKTREKNKETRQEREDMIDNFPDIIARLREVLDGLEPTKQTKQSTHKLPLKATLKTSFQKIERADTKYIKVDSVKSAAKILRANNANIAKFTEKADDRKSYYDISKVNQRLTGATKITSSKLANYYNLAGTAFYIKMDAEDLSGMYYASAALGDGETHVRKFLRLREQANPAVYGEVEDYDEEGDYDDEEDYDDDDGDEEGELDAF